VSNTQARRPSFVSSAATLRPVSEENQSSHQSSPSDLTPSEANDTPSLRWAITGRSLPIVSPRRTARIQQSPGRSQATERPRRWPRFRVSSQRGTCRHPPEAVRPDRQRKVERARRTTSCGSANKHTRPRAKPGPARRQATGSLTAGIEDTFPRFIAFRRNQMHRSLTCWLTSPAPSPLRVSHPLRGLIPVHPRGCISSHIHP